MGKPLDIGFNIFVVSSPTSTTTSGIISTPSPTSTTNSHQNKTNSRINMGVTVGLGVGVGVGGAILLTAVGLFLWRRRQLTRSPNPGEKIECYTLPDDQYKDPKVFESNVFPVELGPGRRHNVPQELEVR
ncbi:hypothetical protein PENFLA_c018G09964 [Penicillium flavigenum]|uniref:Mid2 domain-containing protein n=1 Tax=Penicillium flavigenum TaxID=254877 RepID=A0A1V6T125_9EURO|nr:hypothetical protein PENFLA_c018G09964 [Penicillium flavigenum]